MVYTFDISEKEFYLLRDFIHLNFGIYFDDDKCSMLRMKLYPRVIALSFGSYGEYLNYVKYHPEKDGEIPKMISALVNNETYFFREFKQLQVFKDIILPSVIENNVKKYIHSVNILSAGCSTGEEVYTLAALSQNCTDCDVRVRGLDISRRALDIAEKASYKERSLRMTDVKYRNSCFKPSDSGFTPVDHIRGMTGFVQGNIVDPDCWKTMKGQDIIFCRNVLIYFSNEKTEEAISYIHEALNPGGYLFLGHSEILRSNRDQFEVERHPGTMVFKKK